MKFKRFTGEDMQTMLFRSAVILDAFGGVELTDDNGKSQRVKSVNHLSDTLKKKLLNREYSEQNERLIVLFSLGAIDEETLKFIILHTGDIDILDDITAFENRIMQDEGENSNEVVDNTVLCEILLVAVVSKKYDEISPISFEQAAILRSNTHIQFHNGFVYCDSDLMQFLHNQGKCLGEIDTESDIIGIFNDEYISQVNDDCEFERKPFVLNLNYLLEYASIYNKPYGIDYMQYVQDNGIQIDTSNPLSDYTEYVDKIRLSFDFSGYNRKRSICGSKVNHLDYCQLSVDNDTCEIGNVNYEDMYHAVILLNADDVHYTFDELIQKAIDKYCGTHALLDSTLLEVKNCGITKRFIYHKESNSFNSVDNNEFTKDLFDFNAVWASVQRAVSSKKIKYVNGNIIIPQEIKDEMRSELADQYSYAENYLCYQFSLYDANRKSNKLLQKFSELKAAAHENAVKRDMVASAKEDMGTKKNNRNSCTNV